MIEPIFVDSFAWIAAINKSDNYHEISLRILEELLNKHAKLITTNYVVVETINALRVRSKINLHFQVLRRSHGKTQGGRIASYLTDEQRSHAGWIGASKCEVIFERALSKAELRKTVIEFIDKLGKSPSVQIVKITDEIYNNAWTLYQQRMDKDWGITDCTSFEVMQMFNVRKAFTGDKHFEQAGYSLIVK